MRAEMSRLRCGPDEPAGCGCRLPRPRDRADGRVITGALWRRVGSAEARRIGPGAGAGAGAHPQSSIVDHTLSPATVRADAAVRCGSGSVIVTR